MIKSAYRSLADLILNKQFLLVFAIIAGLKFTYLFIFGYAVEEDSYGYLICILHFEYPPAYGYFLYFLRNIYPSLYLVSIVQIILFSLSASVFIKYFLKNQKAGIIFSLILGIDPITSFFCSVVLSECLFIVFLFPWSISVYSYYKDQSNSTYKLLLIGALSGILYSIRFAGILFCVVPFMLSILLIARKTELIKIGLLLFIGFQITILPIRLKYKMTFDTYQFNCFTGTVLWNNASAIYPYSDVRENPESRFEKFLATFDTTNFTQEKSIVAWQKWEADSPYRKYIDEYGYEFEDLPKLSEELKTTALKIIVDRPYLYFSKFVVPNFLKVFLQDKHQDINIYQDYYKDVYHFSAPKTVQYNKLVWISYFVLLIVTTMIQFFSRTPNSYCKLIILLCWCYILILPFIAVIAFRHYTILAPFILLSIFLQITNSKRKYLFI